MKVYVVEKFVDYECSTQIPKVFGDKEKAWNYCRTEIGIIQIEDFPDKLIEDLLRGYRVGDKGIFFHEMEVE